MENTRLSSLNEKTMMFQLKMLHVPAKKHAGPDTLSRNPVCQKGLLEEMDTKQARQSEWNFFVYKWAVLHKVGCRTKC